MPDHYEQYRNPMVIGTCTPWAKVACTRTSPAQSMSCSIEHGMALLTHLMKVSISRFAFDSPLADDGLFIKRLGDGCQRLVAHPDLAMTATIATQCAP